MVSRGWPRMATARPPMSAYGAPSDSRIPVTASRITSDRPSKATAFVLPDASGEED